MTTSRRALLGMAGAAAAAVALKPDAASAADGGNMKLGMENLAESHTYLTGGRNSGLTVTSTIDDGAVVGVNTAHDGDGLRGTGARGVTGIGIANDLTKGVGVSAGSDSGTALDASTWDGTAVHASATGPGSIALDVQGMVRFSSSGRVKIASGVNKVAVPNVQGSMVLATLQGFQTGLSVAGVVLAGTTATIRLSKATTAPIDVAWFALG
jgi:hypothetical protein